MGFGVAFLNNCAYSWTKEQTKQSDILNLHANDMYQGIELLAGVQATDLVFPMSQQVARNLESDLGNPSGGGLVAC